MLALFFILLVPSSSGDSYEFSTSIYNNTTLTSCDEKTCVRKCCNLNYVPVHKKCVWNDTSAFKDFLTNNGVKDYEFFPGITACPSNKHYLLNALLYDDDAFVLEKSGRLRLNVSGDLFQYDEFCVDYFENVGVTALICFPEKTLTMKIWKGLRLTGMIISMPFLLLTFLVYAVLPDRNLHGKCLMCYVSTLFGAYALLIFIQLYPDTIEAKACKALGIVCMFFFMVSFFWMSVMSIDIFLAFSGRRGFSGSRKQAEMKRFLLYNLYAWGMPMILVIIVTSLSLADDINTNAWYYPGIGAGQCWFADGFPTMLYFYLPISLIIITNITLFGTTACKIKRVQQDTAMLRKDESKKHSYENDKQRFNLYVKLLLAMGVNWSMEIISWLVDWRIGNIPVAVWYLTDFCNALYGVFVFFIFVFKPNIWKLLKKRYYVMIGRPNLARTLTQSAYSRRTTGSSLNHTISNDKSFANDSSVLTSEVA